MADFKQWVFANDGVKSAKRADVSAPAVFLGEKVKKEECQKKKPPHPKTKYYASVSHADGTDNLKCRDREAKREKKRESDSPVADLTAQKRWRIFASKTEFSSKSSGGFGDDVYGADPWTKKSSPDNTVKKEYDSHAD